MEDYLGRVIFYQKRPFTRAQFRRFTFAQYPEMIEPVARFKARHRLKIAAVGNEGCEQYIAKYGDVLPAIRYWKRDATKTGRPV